MTLQQKQHKIKIALLIILVLGEKQKRIKDDFMLIKSITNAVEILSWTIELKKLYSIETND